MKHYKLISSEQTADGIRFTTYGIAGENTSFADVSTDRSAVEEMINRINTEQLEESQLMYFIKDELDK
ncbi:MAG: hypothetical protein IKM66_02275 [Clostridia bacterium]|nr:hypothetical protein [Clostridia bacterium]